MLYLSLHLLRFCSFRFLFPQHLYSSIEIASMLFALVSIPFDMQISFFSYQITFGIIWIILFPNNNYLLGKEALLDFH
ncbi:MAG: hypothetical protein EXX96DRAFT_562084 [Benjaminiella poitrasii]|nr:MAG: hypothetical protein EXX96DRAFT_562084 [Benjaminiella poitrasii]